jgi:hypothetical protein
VKKEIKRGIVVTLGFLLILLAINLLFSCSPKIVEKIETKVEYRDSIRVEVRERIVHDTVKVQVPVEIEKVVTPSDSSHIETSFAVSEAVMKDGMLHHSIWNKPQAIEVPVAIPVKDSTEYHQTSSVNDTAVEKTVYVEKPLSWWQKFRIWAFFPLLLAVLYLGRKYIWKFIELILKLI